ARGVADQTRVHQRLQQEAGDEDCVFYQAEDGIREFHVTGVQTCALPILTSSSTCGKTTGKSPGESCSGCWWISIRKSASCLGSRSEERRVGKEGSSLRSTQNERETEKARDGTVALQDRPQAERRDVK